MLSVGELNANKNHAVVIRAIANLQNPSLHYAIAGIGELHDDLLNLAAELSVADRVHLLGYRSDVADLYQAADLYIHPSKREGLPVALMEAIASGLPAIGSNIRGNVDLVCENSLFDPKCIHQTTEKIRLYITSDSTAEIGRKYLTVSIFDIKNVEKKMKTIYFRQRK